MTEKRGDPTFLRIYMNDQLALGVLWREVARRAARENGGTEVGAALVEVAAAIAEDVRTFEQLMDQLAIRRNPIKPTLAALAERAGRLKLNGRVREYSPLSRFAELDFLAAGLEGKKLLWENLRDLAGLRERLPDVDFDDLIARAETQRAILEPHRRAAGRAALDAEPAKARRR
jgi:hypothetical protein